MLPGLGLMVNLRASYQALREFEKNSLFIQLRVKPLYMRRQVQDCPHKKLNVSVACGMVSQVPEWNDRMEGIQSHSS